MADKKNKNLDPSESWRRFYTDEDDLIIIPPKPPKKQLFIVDKK